MFFYNALKHTIQLHPSFFGPNIVQHLELQLKQEVEGTCNGETGYIVKVMKVIDIGDGLIIPGGEGRAEFNMEYHAIVLKPFKGEVVDVIVTNVNKMGFFASYAPVEVFVSVHLLPVDYKFQPDSNPAEFVSPNGTTLVKGKKCRIRIVGTRVEANEIFAIGTMKEDYLGPFD